MNDSIKTRSRSARWAGAAGLIAAGAITGGVLAGTLSASAATTATPSGTSSSSTSESGTGQPAFPAHGSAAHEGAEKAVTGTNATKAQAAAVKIVGSGTAGAVTTDMSGTGYEVTVTKADGSTVEVHMNASFTEVGPGGHGGGPGGAPDDGAGTGGA
jgi:hypothetical protein